MNFTLDGRFTKRCFCCKTVPVGPFGVSCTERRCTNQACSSNKNWRALEQEVLAPILPEWRLPTLDALPGILASESGFAADGSIIWADSEDELPETHKNYICKEFDEGKWNELFPFDKNFLACNGLLAGLTQRPPPLA